MLPEDIFPYPSFRPGQRELADSVYLACKNGQRFVAEAMSGFGKTAAVLAGALAAANEEGLDVVYVCRTKRQVQRVLEELNRFSGRLPIHATSLFSKYDYCLLRQGNHAVSQEAFKWYCGFHTSNNLCSYFLNASLNHDRVAAFVDAYTGRAGSTAELLEKGNELHVCPYEIAKLSVARSKVVVTTYHYLLDEGSRTVLIPKDRPLGNAVAVIDEAHNIREFVAGASTTSLSLSDLRESVQDSRRFYLPSVCEAVSEVADRVAHFWEAGDAWMVRKEDLAKAAVGEHPKDWLPGLVTELSANARVAWFSVATEQELPPSLARLGSFLGALLSALPSDRTALLRSERSLSLVDSDPAKRFLDATAGFRTLVLLSATINPPGLFLRSIGLDESSTVLHSAAATESFRIKTVIDMGVTTRFKMRTPEAHRRIAKRLAAIIGATPGGVGVFFPSYAFLESIRPSLASELAAPSMSKRAGPTIMAERPDLSNQESDAIMKTFRSAKCVLLAVQGGRFSEGEDFSGDSMDVSAVVGLSLPPPSPSLFADYRQLERDGFTSHEAYMVLSLLPALRKAFQSAGRHVRNPGKVGMVFLLDSRFGDQKAIELMPSWLKQDLVKGSFEPEEASSIAQEFFFASRAT